MVLPVQPGKLGAINQSPGRFRLDLSLFFFSSEGRSPRRVVRSFSETLLSRIDPALCTGNSAAAEAILESSECAGPAFLIPKVFVAKVPASVLTPVYLFGSQRTGAEFLPN
jgi:hypothetical protein